MPQKCESCQRFSGGCVWTNGSFTPIPGWDATPIFSGPGEIRSYEIRGCPGFLDDGTGQRERPHRRLHYDLEKIRALCEKGCPIKEIQLQMGMTRQEVVRYLRYMRERSCG